MFDLWAAIWEELAILEKQHGKDTYVMLAGYLAMAECDVLKETIAKLTTELPKQPTKKKRHKTEST